MTALVVLLCVVCFVAGYCFRVLLEVLVAAEKPWVGIDRGAGDDLTGYSRKQIIDTFRVPAHLHSQQPLDAMPCEHVWALPYQGASFYECKHCGERE